MEISFPGQNKAQASVLARAMRQSLIRAGVPEAQLVIRRDDPEAQDFGTCLLVFVAAVHTGHFALDIFECCRKHQSGVRIKGANGGAVEFPSGKLDVEQLEKALEKLKDNER